MNGVELVGIPEIVERLSCESGATSAATSAALCTGTSDSCDPKRAFAFRNSVGVAAAVAEKNPRVQFVSAVVWTSAGPIVGTVFRIPT